MRILKNKVARAIQTVQAPQDINIKVETSTSQEADKVYIKQEPNIVVKSEPITPAKKDSKAKPEPYTQRQKGPKKEIQSNKNIVKNYARAMINFALSNMARAQLNKILQKECVDLQSFKKFVQAQKEDINSIKKLRELLLITEEDSEKTAALKRAFARISEVFVKFYSVNWIFNSKVSDKLIHLRYRFKILRRIRNPEHFTYLENFNKTK